MANISTWSTTAGSNNSAAPDGFPEGMLASGVNDAAREVMAAVRRWYEDAEWINLGHTPTRTGNTTFTIATDVTSTYHVGRRIKVTGSATGYAVISASSYSAPDTTITVVNDSGNLPATLSTVAVGIVSKSNSSQPSPFLSAVKTAATSRNNTTTKTDDPHLVLTVTANTKYVAEIMFRWNCATTVFQGIAVGISVPSGAGFSGHVVYTDGSGTTTDAFATSSSVTTTPAVANTVYTFWIRGVLDVGSTGGTFGLSWAQFSSHANNTTIFGDNSVIIAERIA